MERYSEILEKNRREIVLLRGSGCRWRRCRFCDYHLDASANENENIQLNKEVLSRVTGRFHKLEVINSGSFPELPNQTMQDIEDICIKKGITELHFECHYHFRDAVAPLKARMDKKGICVKIKSGIETFDDLFRESYLGKGIGNASPKALAEYFDEVCLLFGLPGQTEKSMERDIEIGLSYFERVCVNIMQKNSAAILPDPDVIQIFLEKIYPRYVKNERVDILLENTDFGVGGEKKEEKNLCQTNLF